MWLTLIFWSALVQFPVPQPKTSWFLWPGNRGGYVVRSGYVVRGGYGGRGEQEKERPRGGVCPSVAQQCWTSICPDGWLQAQSARPCVRALVGMLLVVPPWLPEDSCSLKLPCSELSYFLCTPPTSGAPGPASPRGCREGAEGEGGGPAEEGTAGADGEGPPRAHQPLRYGGQDVWLPGDFRQPARPGRPGA